jgi:YD repeat-containing protein
MRLLLKTGRPYATATLLLACYTFSSFANDLPTTKEASPGASPLGETNVQSDVDSIDPYSGSLRIKHLDISLATRSALPIKIYRNYDLRALSAGLKAQHNQSHWWTSLGAGWRLDAAPIISFENFWTGGTKAGSGDQVPQAYYIPTAMDAICANASTYSRALYLTLRLPTGETTLLFSQGNKTALSKDNWKLKCDNWNVSLFSPDGVRYDFGNFKIKKTTGLFRFTKPKPPTQPIMWAPPEDSETYITADTATDPNGNWLKYTYTRVGAALPTWTTPKSYDGPSYFSFNGSGTELEGRTMLLSKIVSSEGTSVALSYAANGRLQQIVDNAGRKTTYSYSATDSVLGGFLVKVSLPTGDAWSYDYQPGKYTLGYPDDTVLPLNTTTVAARKLVAIHHPTGGVTSYTYTFLNAKANVKSTDKLYLREERISSRTLSSGHTWNYKYARGGTGQLDQTLVSGPDGQHSYKYFGMGFSIQTSIPALANNNTAWKVGHIVEHANPNGTLLKNEWQPRKIANYQYRIYELGTVVDQYIWAADLKSKTIVRDGALYTTNLSNFDIYGNAGTKIEAGPNGGNRTTTFTYFNDPTKWIVGKISNEIASGKSLIRTFDANGNVLTETRDGTTTTFTYDSKGYISSKTLPGGRVYTYSNYKYGIAQTEIRPENVTITRVVDDVGNITAQTTGEGNTTSYTYDGMDRITSVTPPLGNPRTIVYTATSKTVKRGSLVDMTQYDPFGRIASITLAGVTRTFTYDGLGRKTFESNPGESIGTTYLYDSHHRLTRQINSDGTFQSLTYGPANALVTDERGKTTTYTYRAYGDPDKQLLMAITAPEASANVSIERSPNDLITEVTQAGLKRTYGYNENNYLISATNPETGITTYGRDVAGNMTSKKVGASDATKYTYDALDRLRSTTYPGATPAITNTYNKNGKLLSSNAAGGNRNFVYDAVDNLIQDSLTLDGHIFTVHFKYNGNGDLSGITYPQSSRVVSYAPDALGRPTMVSGYVSNVKYWPSGLIQSITYNNGTVSTYDQNARLWPSTFTTQKTATATAYLNSSYTYDGVGNLASISDTVDSNFNRTLGYDGINRLTSAAGFWGQGNITYDGGGNLTSQTLGQSSLAYAYDASNRLSGVSGLRADTFGYDAYGNVSSSQDNSYAYNDVPNLVCINCASPTAKVEYRYDGLNHRSSVTKGSGKIYEMHDSNGKPLIELDGDTLTEYFYLGDKRVAQQVSP